MNYCPCNRSTRATLHLEPDSYAQTSLVCVSVTPLQIPGGAGDVEKNPFHPQVPSPWQRMQFSALPAEGNRNASAGEGCGGALEVHFRGPSLGRISRAFVGLLMEGFSGSLPYLQTP